MKKGIFTLLSFCALLLWGPGASAKIWRVNNNAGVNADFSDLPAAITGAAAGDTLYLESSATAYSTSTLTKKLTIIGTGYFLSGSPVNPYTQANPNSSSVGTLYLEDGCSGSVIAGLSITGELVLQDSSVTLERNYISSTFYLGYPNGTNYVYKDTIRQNYMYGVTAYPSQTFTISNLLIYNNIIESGIDLTAVINTASGYIINNDIGNAYYGGATFNVANFEFQNNILDGPSFGSYLNSNVYFNNISTNAVIPAGNANVNNASFSAIYFGGTYTGYPPPTETHTQDSAFTLAAGSPALGAGALNGTTVDCGAFGGPAPYILSGMPPIPSIYALTAPTQVNAGTATVNVTISSASH